MNIRLQGAYKSITELDWQHIPPLAVVTGVNGSGKSQLLELLHEKKERTSVGFTKGLQLKYPKWLLERRGKELEQVFRNTFGQHVINKNSLLDALERVRFVPMDLATLFRNIQKHGKESSTT